MFNSTKIKEKHKIYSKGIIKNLGVGKFCPNSKCPDKSSSELTRFDLF